MFSGEVVRRRARGVFFGWWIVVGGMGLQALVNGLLMQSYGAYVVLLQAEFGWSKTVFSVAYSLQRAESGLLGPLQGWMLDRFGPGAIVRIGVAMFGLGLILFSQVNSIGMFYAVFLIMAIGTSLGGFLSISTALINWFHRKRATVMGVVQIGASVGGFSVPLVAWSLTTYGWRETAFVSGLIVLAVGFPLSFLMRHRPEDYGSLPDGAKPDALTLPGATRPAPSDELVEFRTGEALRTPAFWFISLGHSLALMVVAAVTVHLVVHLTEGLGYSLAAAASIVALLTGVTLVGNLLGGFLGDRFNKRLLITIGMFGHVLALLILAWFSSIFMVILFTVLQGLGHGLRGVLMQPIRVDYFGRHSFGMIMGVSGLVVMWGQMAGPIIAGVMADRLGNYQMGFTILAGLSALGTVFFMLARKPEPPRRLQATEAVVEG